MGQVAIFMDGGYIDKVLREEFGRTRIWYDKFANEICSHIGTSCELFRVYYYHCLPYKSSRPTTEESKRFAASEKFYNTLNKLPRFEIRLGRLDCHSDSG
jgi:hypothetical protein